MTIIANLDAEIEQFYAEQGTTEREIQIFGRVWPLIPAMTSITLAPLMNLQAAAQAAESGQIDASDHETRQALFAFLGDTNAILANVVREDVRGEFYTVANKVGFPLGILDKVIEAVMQAFDAAPFGSATPTSPERAKPVPLHVSLSGSGNSSTPRGDTSMPTSTPTPSATTPQPAPVSAPPLAAVPTPAPVASPEPQASGAGLHVAEWETEPTLPAYSDETALIPPSVQDVPHQS